MGPKVTGVVTGSLIWFIALSGVCSVGGCGQDTSTGTSVTKPLGAAEAEKKSMENMKAIMKDLAKKKKR